MWGFRDWAKRLVKRPYELGTVLLNMGVIDGADLARAVHAQKSSGAKLGEALLALGMIRPEHLEKALELQGKLRNGGRVDATAEMTQHNLASALRRLTPTKVIHP